jgi:hypothetical protein
MNTHRGGEMKAKMTEEEKAFRKWFRDSEAPLEGTYPGKLLNALLKAVREDERRKIKAENMERERELIKIFEPYK